MYGKQQSNYIYTQDFIFSKVREEDIYNIVFNTKIEYDVHTYKNPIREDKEGRCFFTYNNGVLWFIDYGNVDITHYTAITFIKEYYNLSHLEAMKYIAGYFNITEQSITVNENHIKYSTEHNIKERVNITYIKNKFENKDYAFWNKYFISKENLEEDNILKIIQMKIINNTKTSTINFFKPVFVIYQSLDKERIKIYQPNVKNFRFTTNCNKNDIGNIENYNSNNQNLIITKSYKDCRVLRNLNIPNTNIIWFQNEGSKPDDENVINKIKSHKNIILLFDNDNAGIKASKKIKNYLFENYNIVVKLRYIPLKYGKDISDLIAKEGKKYISEIFYKKIWINIK